MPSKVKGMTVFNTEDVNTKKQPMFFGAPLGVQRYDNFKYPAFENLTKQVKANITSFSPWERGMTLLKSRNMPCHLQSNSSR